MISKQILTTQLQLNKLIQFFTIKSMVIFGTRFFSVGVTMK